MINGKKETLWGGFVFVCLPEQNGDDAFNGSIFINFTRKTSTAICAETRTQLHSHPHDSHIPLLSPSSSSAAPARLFPSCADFLPHHHDNVIQPLYQNNMTAYVVKVNKSVLFFLPVAVFRTVGDLLTFAIFGTASHLVLQEPLRTCSSTFGALVREKMIRLWQEQLTCEDDGGYCYIFKCKVGTRRSS